jgi:hypothetical protein
MNMQRTLAAAICGALIIAPIGMSRAQTETDSAKAVRHDAAAANLAKAAQNPVANMVSLPLQWNFNSGGGLDSSTALVLNVQPVLPLPIGERWLIVARTVVPFVSLPLPNGRQTSGIADIQEQAYFTKSKPGKITWALGPVFSFPTATNFLTRTGQWGMGPTAVVLTMPRQWVIGVLANNIWRIGGESHGKALNSFTLQPFINFNLPRAWAISTGPLITANWSAPDDERWTVPVGLGVSKITHIMEQPRNLAIQYYHNVEHPRRAGNNEVRFFVAALWPTAAAEAAKKKETQVASKKKNQSRNASDDIRHLVEAWTTVAGTIFPNVAGGQRYAQADPLPSTERRRGEERDRRLRAGDHHSRPARRSSHQKRASPRSTRMERCGWSIRSTRTADVQPGSRSGPRGQEARARERRAIQDRALRRSRSDREAADGGAREDPRRHAQRNDGRAVTAEAKKWIAGENTRGGSGRTPS